MERKRSVTVLVLLLITLSIVNATRNYIVYNSYVVDSMDHWRKVMVDMENSKSLTEQETLELLNYEYGYIGWCIANDLEDEAEKWIKHADRNIGFLDDINYNQSMICAYKAAFYGFKIGLNPLMAPFYGPKSMDNAKLALAKNPNNWFAIIQHANILYYMPNVFGGSKPGAIELYKKALVIMEDDTDLMHQNWNYLNLIITIANAYEETGHSQLSQQYYQKAIQFEPNFKWAQQQLKH